MSAFLCAYVVNVALCVLFMLPFMCSVMLRFPKDSFVLGNTEFFRP